MMTVFLGSAEACQRGGQGSGGEGGGGAGAGL